MSNCFEHLSYNQLKQKVAELEKQFHMAEDELIDRNPSDVRKWRCCECNFSNVDSEVVYQHLLNVHHYPEEDASISMVEFFE